MNTDDRDVMISLARDYLTKAKVRSNIDEQNILLNKSAKIILGIVGGKNKNGC